LPEHDELSKYSADHQERIFRIAEAFTSDESRRRTEINDAQIRQSGRAQIITPVLLLIFGGVAAYFFSVDNWRAGIAFLTLPLLRFLGTFVSTFAIRRRKADDE